MTKKGYAIMVGITVQKSDGMDAESSKVRKDIVLIDSSEEDQLVIAATVSACGYNCMTVRNARKVTSFFAQQKAMWAPEAILVDLILEGSSGFEVVRTLKERFDAHKVPFIVISKLASETDIHEAHMVGADAFVKKPFGPKDLLEAMEFARENVKKPITEKSHSIFVKK